MKVHLSPLYRDANSTLKHLCPNRMQTRAAFRLQYRLFQRSMRIWAWDSCRSSKLHYRRLLKDMIRDGYVEKQPIARDRRSYALFVTAKGSERFIELARHAAAHDRRLDEIVGDQKDELLNLLRRISAEIE